jgi:hypothetical protein
MDNFPTFEAVKAANDPSVPRVVEYEHDNFAWRSDYRIIVKNELKGKKKKGLKKLKKILSIHLPNDGKQYSREEVLDVKTSGLMNDRHHNSCRDGWACLNLDVEWPKLKPFEDWAQKWFGYTNGEKLRRNILYHAPKNRIDISLLCDKTNVAVEFSFEPGIPLAPYDEFDHHE